MKFGNKCYPRKESSCTTIVKDVKIKGCAAYFKDVDASNF